MRRTGEHEVGLDDVGMQAAVFVETLRRSIQGTLVFGEKASLQWGCLVRRGEGEQAMDTYLLVTATGKGTRPMVVFLDSEKKYRVRSENTEHSVMVDKKLG